MQNERKAKGDRRAKKKAPGGNQKMTGPKTKTGKDQRVKRGGEGKRKESKKVS